MITADRAGTTLPTGEAPDPSFGWAARIAATNGDFVTPSGWTYYELPPEALVGRNRTAQLDGATWAATVEVLASALPETTDPLAYYQLELDLVDRNGRHWPYFTGPIDTISDSYAELDGAIVQTQRIEAHGVMQRGKGMRINVLDVTPARTGYTGLMTGLAQAVTIAVVKNVTGASTNTITGSRHTVDATVGTGSFPGIIIDNNADFTSPLTYGAGATEYTITATSPNDLTINWGASVAGDAGTPVTYYVKFWALQRFIVRRDWSGAGSPAFIRIPDGGVAYSGADSIPKRRWWDTFQTIAASGCTTTAITVRDPGPFDSDNALVAVSGGPTEYLIWTKTDGTEEARAITSTDASGVITVSAFSAAPAAGDPIRLGTTEPVRSWEFWNRNTGNTAAQAKFFSDAAKTTEYEYTRASFGVEPRTGYLAPLAGRHYLSASSLVYAGNGSDQLYTVLDASAAFSAGSTTDNRIENLYYLLLTNDANGAGLNFLRTQDFVSSGLSGGYIKSLTLYDTSFDDVIGYMGENGLPPNGYAHDTPAGKIRVDGFTQATTPDLAIARTIGVEISSLPEPKTGVAVVSKGPERNIAGQCRPRWTASDWTNPGYMFDGTKDGTLVATFSGAGITSAIVRLDVTALTPQAFPHITGLRIHMGPNSTGAVAVSVERYNRTTRALERSRMVEGVSYMMLSAGGDNFIPGERLQEALGSLSGVATTYHEIVLTFYRDDTTGSPGTAPSITEIEVLSDVDAAWTAYLTDDSSGSPPTGWTTTNNEGFGSIWWQRNLTAAQSYRFASAAWAKRVLPKWASTYSSQLHRLEKLTIDQITQDECRDYAERYLDEYVRQGREYRVRAVLDPRVDLGDTVSLTLPDGTVRNLFVWAMADGGGKNDFEAEYTLLDYAA